MSTFRGIVKEFPQIRIDYFRTIPDHKPPLACFLSHVHSDHLLGLDSLKSPFVYCSSATRELLLRLEKYTHRVNFNEGILECQKRTYQHLRKLLKPIPLETPTVIELNPECKIQVTLFDANHCTGAVMFLVEGDGQAILYTGDTRSELWLVNSLTRHPVLLPFASGIKRLDCLYLDTTFAVEGDPYRHFPSKAEGLQELLRIVAKYPSDTIFYFRAWTFGYEEVWIALSRALGSPVHLDRYRWGMYSSLGKVTDVDMHCREAPALCGFKCGNTQIPGCLTPDSRVRLHSCENGGGCPIFVDRSKVVTITPIISRYAGQDIRELGAGGGHGDLDKKHELDARDPRAINQLLELCVSKSGASAEVKQLKDMLKSPAPRDGVLHPATRHVSLPAADLTLPQAAELITSLAVADCRDHTGPAPSTSKRSTHHETNANLPAYITFPYSRHSSYAELVSLVSAFRPRDIYPCTTPPDEEWMEDVSMRSLFADACGESVFSHDVEMRALKAQRDLAMINERRYSQERASVTPQPDPRRAASSPQSTRSSSTCTSLASDCVIGIEDSLVGTRGDENGVSAQSPDWHDTVTSQRISTARLIESQSKRTMSHMQRTSRSRSPATDQRIQRRMEAFAAAREARWGAEGAEVNVTASQRSMSEEL